MGIIRRVVEPKLQAAVHAEIQKRQIDVAHRTPAELVVAVCSILDSFHIVEDAGNNRSKSGMVELLQETIGGHDAESYCMSTQQSVTGLVESFTNKRSNLPASEGCLDTANQAKKQGVKTLPWNAPDILPGDIAIWQHGTGGNGHTGRVVKVGEKGKFTCFEGNTGPGSNVNRNGDGCYMKERDRSPHGDMHLVGFIRESFT